MSKWRFVNFSNKWNFGPKIQILIFLFMFIDRDLILCSSLDDQAENSNEQMKGLFCVNEINPCYYYYCNDQHSIPEITNSFMCAKGLIFDQQQQKCVWSLPWHSCQSIKTNISVSNTTSDKKVIKPVASVLYKPSTDEKNLFSILSSSDARLNYLKSKYRSPPQDANEKDYGQKNEHDIYDYKDKTEVSYLPNQLHENMNSLEYKYDEDLNLTTSKTIARSSLSNQGLKEQVNYAYIIVPIKINKYQTNLSRIDLLKKKINFSENLKQYTKAKKKGKKNKNNKKPSKNYEEIFKYKKICYVTNWSQYRPKPAQFVPENIDPFLCTHIVYAFAYIDNNNLTIKTIEENDEEMYRRINDLKFKNPKLKTMLGIGGWNMGSKEFSKMSKNKVTRENFINHAIKFLRIHGFDGIDLDWEFPADRGGSPDDKPNLTFLLKELRQAINVESVENNKDPLIVSLAVAAGKKRIDQGYEVKEIVSELDFINLMAFDFHGNWDDQTGLNAPLYTHENVTEDDYEMNQDWSVSYWIKNGCPPHKLILGLPAYGRTFRLKDKNKNELSSKTKGTDAISGNFTQTSGFLSFYEICEIRKKSNWDQVWLAQSKSHYMHKDYDWISFDDIKSFHLRAAYVVAKKLGGIFIWSIDMDDFSGKFCDLGSYPLIKNSMSLLMDYLPEWYSSNVNQAEKANTKKTEIVPNTSKVFYVLKDDLNDLDNLSQMTNIEQDIDLAKQNRIRNDLMFLLARQPDKFLSVDLPYAFNCANKQKGVHRDPFDCTTYYYCDDLYSNTNVKTTPIKCPENSVFNMNGCYCDSSIINKSFSCDYLSQTHCDTKKFNKYP